MEQVGTLAQLWRYPVKSLQGEQVSSLELGSGGATGDRTLAIVDPEARKVLSAKRHPELLMAAARLDGDDVILTLPDGTEHGAGDADTDAALSAWLGRDVQLRPPPPEVAMPMEMYTGMSDESTPLFDWAGPAGTWLDLADVHWLTSSSLAAIAADHRDGAWDVRRFRPTGLIDGAESGFAEQRWAQVAIGAVTTAVLMATPRCSMPSRAQPGLDRDLRIGETIRDANDNNLGVYAQVTTPGVVHVGDPVLAAPGDAAGG